MGKTLIVILIVSLVLLSGCDNSIRLSKVDTEFIELNYNNCLLKDGKQYYSDEKGYIIDENDKIICIPKSN